MYIFTYICRLNCRIYVPCYESSHMWWSSFPSNFKFHRQISFQSVFVHKTDGGLQVGIIQIRSRRVVRRGGGGGGITGFVVVVVGIIAVRFSSCRVVFLMFSFGSYCF